MTRILLVRHGRSAHVHSGLVDHAGVHAWRSSYDSAGLAQDDTPPPTLCQLAREVGIIVSSDLPRAVESAALLAPDRPILQLAALRETELAIPPLRARLPIGVWNFVIGLRWLFDIRRRGYVVPELLRARCADAVITLAQLADEHQSVLVVTHGAFRRYLADALESDGWRRTRSRRPYGHWSVWELVRAPTISARQTYRK